MHDASMDEDSFACGDFAKAEAFVDKPLVDDKLHGFGLVTESFLQVGFTFFVVLLVLLSFQPVQFSGRNFTGGGVHEEGLPFGWQMEFSFLTLGLYACRCIGKLVDELDLGYLHRLLNFLDYGVCLCAVTGTFTTLSRNWTGGVAAVFCRKTGTVAVGKTVGAAVIVVTGAAQATV